MDLDRELLRRVNEVDDFFGSVFEDRLEDWNLASDLGEFLLRIGGPEAMGHMLLARAHRHLGNRERAREELKRCQLLVAKGELVPGEVDMFTQLLAEEEEFLRDR
jgi:hypothetical protein